MLIDAQVMAGIVVDRRGAVMGLLTVEAIGEQLRFLGRQTAPADQPLVPEAAPTASEP